MFCWRGILAAAGLGLSLVLGLGCAGGSKLVDERNPLFNRGLQLRKEGRYTEAVESFAKCLRVSPDSAKAHLQLGVLYEDNLGDPLSAVYHYRAFIAKRPDAENVDLVRRWLARAEESCLRELAARYPGSQGSTDSGQAERERALGQKVKDLTSQLAALREQLRVTTPSPAPAPAGAATGPAAAAAGRTYVVKKGDTLTRIAVDQYGSARYWMFVRDSNQDVLHGKDALTTGMQLKLPPRPAAAPPARSASAAGGTGPAPTTRAP